MSAPTPRPVPTLTPRTSRLPVQLFIASNLYEIFVGNASAETVIGGTSSSYAGPKPNRLKWKISEKIIQYPIEASAWGGNAVTNLDRARKIMKAICLVGNSVPAPFTPPGPCPAGTEPGSRGGLACTTPVVVAGNLDFPHQGVISYVNHPINLLKKFPLGQMTNTTHNLLSNSVYVSAPEIPSGTFHAEIDIQIHIPSLTQGDKTILNRIDPRLTQVAEAQIASLLTHERVHVADLTAGFNEQQLLDRVALDRLKGQTFGTRGAAANALQAEIDRAYDESIARFEEKTSRFHIKELSPLRNSQRGMAVIPVPGFVGLQCDGAATIFMRRSP